MLNKKRLKEKNKFVLIIIFIILSVYILFEIILRLFGFYFYPPSDSLLYNDMYFEENNGTDTYGFRGYEAASLTGYRKEDYKSYDLTVKNDNEFRIFILGGSVAMFLYPELYKLKELLQEKYPDKKFTIYDFGVGSIGTTRIMQFYPELFEYKPDLIIIHSGNNEFQEKIYKYNLETSNSYLKNVNFFLLKYSRSYQFLSKVVYSGRIFLIETKLMNANVFMKWNSEPINCSDVYVDEVMNNYENNLIGMAKIAHTNGVTVLFSTVSYNPVFIQNKDIINLLIEGKTYAAVHFSEDPEKYRICTGYATPLTNSIVKRVANKTNYSIALIDEAIKDSFVNGSLGYEYFIDYCHYAKFFNSAILEEQKISHEHNKNQFYSLYLDRVVNGYYDNMTIISPFDTWINEIYKTIVNNDLVE